MKWILKRKSNIFIHLILIISSIIFIYPILWAVLSSLKQNEEIFGSPLSFPSTLEFKNYSEIWSDSGLDLAIYNTMFICIIAVLIIIIVSLPASFVLARVKSRINVIIYVIFIGALLVPPDVLFVQLYFQLRDYNLTNSLWGVILPSIALGLPFSIFLLTNFIKEIPQEIIDSATIDGCSRFRVFQKMVIPLIFNTIGAVAVFQFTFIWSSFLLPLVILRRDELKVVPLVLNILVGQKHFTVNYGHLFAASIISFLPVVIIFVLFQRQFIKGGITLAATKG